ncbi:MAG: nucleotide exchange factor GrpE [Desulfobacteraceae bacterium 4484_190.3]|nr:MAG: nucleotide exchange factor GrpE [Desulfobacteraceae bacterium 4484_190.3]
MCNTVVDNNGRDGRCDSDDSKSPGSKRPEHCADEMNAGEGWKKTIQENFELWLEEVSDLETVTQSPDQGPPDLASFFKELCILRTEFRKGARRSHETFVRFGETLSGFERMTQSMLSRTSELERQKEAEDILSKKRIYLPLVEIFERFKRIEGKLGKRPRSGLFARRAWEKKTWKSLRDGFGILRSHFEELLTSEGITTIETVGKPFDPTLMTAIETQETSSVEPGMVVEEFSSGYLYRGHPLKLAHVKVAKPARLDRNDSSRLRA